MKPSTARWLNPGVMDGEHEASALNKCRWGFFLFSPKHSLVVAGMAPGGWVGRPRDSAGNVDLYITLLCFVVEDERASRQYYQL
jgi:hypothetical protein